MNDRPNIVQFVFDAARRDAFEPYGAAPGSSPVVADLAARGVAVEHAYAAGSWTVPSHAAMLSGRLPRQIGLSRAPGGHPQGCRAVLEQHRSNLIAEALREHGYATAAVSTNLWLSELSGFSIGFERWRSIDSQRQSELGANRPRARLRRAREAISAGRDDGAAAAGRCFADWIDEAAAERASGPARPFYWFANLVEAHSPYLPPRPYNPLGPRARLLAAGEASRHLTMGEIWKASLGGYDIPAAALGRMRALYAASIRYLDGWLGEFVSRLDTAGLLEDTLLIICSDHGENFGEDGRMGHSFSLDERLISVPLILAGPGAAPQPGAFSLASLPLLIAAAAGVDPERWADGPPRDGIARAEFDPPIPTDPERVAAALRQWGLGEEAQRLLARSLRAATDGEWKLLREEPAGKGDRYYELAVDRLEQRPQVPGAVPAEVRGRLEAALAKDAPQAQVVRSPNPPAEIDDAERADLEARMRLLGYL